MTCYSTHRIHLQTYAFVIGLEYEKEEDDVPDITAAKETSLPQQKYFLEFLQYLLSFLFLVKFGHEPRPPALEGGEEVSGNEVPVVAVEQD